MRSPLPRSVLVAALLLGGCVSALKTPPDLLDLAGLERPPSPSAVDGILEEAEARYAARTPESVDRAARLWLEAAAADPTRTQGLMGAVRARAWLVDHLDEAEARKEEATSAVQAAQWCLRIAPGDARCAYWLGVALGLQARERRTTGLDALPRIEEAFRRAATEIPDYEEAGPLRALALFHVRAPGWPRGPGDADRGLEEAREAVRRRPDFPPNHLALGEALAAVEERGSSREAYGRALEAARRERAAGHPDAAEWACEAARALGRPCDPEAPDGPAPGGETH